MNKVMLIWGLSGFLGASVLAQVININDSGTGDYPTIQSAIDDSNTDGATIMLAAGRYNEYLLISNKNIRIVGAGVDETIVHYRDLGGESINVIGPGKVEFENMSLKGANWTEDYGGGFIDSSGYNMIVTNNANLFLNKIDFTHSSGYKVRQDGGSFSANNITMDTDNTVSPRDYGFYLTSVTNGVINNLVQTKGQIDHTIGVISSKNIVVNDCVIKSKKDGMGFIESDAEVNNCLIYGGELATEKTGIELSNGSFTNNVSINNCVFSNLVRSIWYDYNSLNSGESNIKLQNNQFINSSQAGVYALDMPINCIDLGGGYLGSKGGNIFSNTNSAAYDILLENSTIKAIFALDNTWSSPNIEEVLYDRLDNSSLPRVIYQRQSINGFSKTPEGNHVLQWNGFNENPTNTAGETFGIEACTNLNENYWFPVASNLTGNVWTNDNVNYKNIFYRNRASTD